MKLKKMLKKSAKKMKKMKWIGIAALVAGSVIEELINDKMMRSAVDECVDEKMAKLIVDLANNGQLIPKNDIIEEVVIEPEGE